MLKMIRNVLPQLIGIFLATFVVASYANIDNADIVKIVQLEKHQPKTQIQQSQVEQMQVASTGTAEVK